MRIDQQPTFVMHGRPYRETSLLLECLTRDHGRIGVVARGVRRERAKLQRSQLEPFQPMALDFLLRGELATLRAAEPIGQPMRLEIFRLLMRKEPDGLPAGTIAEAIGCPHNTLSTHLSILARAGLVRGTRDGRSIVYRANVDGMRNLIAFLVTDCCDGHPELCHLEDALRTNACCAPAPKASARRKK